MRHHRGVQSGQVRAMREQQKKCSSRIGNLVFAIPHSLCPSTQLRDPDYRIFETALERFDRDQPLSLSRRGSGYLTEGHHQFLAPRRAVISDSFRGIFSPARLPSRCDPSFGSLDCMKCLRAAGQAGVKGDHSSKKARRGGDDAWPGFEERLLRAGRRN